MQATVHYQTEAGDYEEQDTLYNVHSPEEVYERCQYDDEGYIDAFVDASMTTGDRIDLEGTMYEVTEDGFEEVN